MNRNCKPEIIMNDSMFQWAAQCTQLHTKATYTFLSHSHSHSLYSIEIYTYIYICVYLSYEKLINTMAVFTQESFLWDDDDDDDITILEVKTPISDIHWYTHKI